MLKPRPISKLSMDYFPTDRDLARLDTAAYSPPKADFSRSISILQTLNHLLKPLAIFFFSYALVGSLVRKRPSHGRMSTASIMSATKVAGAVRTWEQYIGESSSSGVCNFTGGST